MKAFMLKTIASLCLLGVENNVEVTPSLGLNKTISSSEVTVDYQSISYAKGSYYFANPRLNISKSGMFSGGMGLGLRKDLGNSLAGLHLFGDYSYLSGSHHFQVGPSLEFIHPKWDLTLNYYLPLSSKGILDYSIVQAIHHVDGHLFFKTRFADVGIEPSYNWKTNDLGAVAHVMVPTVIGNIRLSAGRNARHGDHAKIGVSFPIYGTISDVHNQKVRRSTGVICNVRTDIPLNPVVVEPIAPIETPVIPQVIEEIIEEVKDESQSWWDYLFGWLVPSEQYMRDNPHLDWLNNDIYTSDDSDYASSYTSPDVGGASDLASSSSSSSDHSSMDISVVDVSNDFLGYSYENSSFTPASDSSSAAADLTSASEYSYSGDASGSSELSTVAEYAELSDSGYIESVGDMLAIEGNYSITVDSGDSSSLAGLDTSFDSSPSCSSNIAGDSPDSSDSYDVIGENSPFSTGH